MKRIFLLTIFVFLLAISCAAQSNLQKSVSDQKARKVTEVLYFCNTDLDMSIASFAKILKKNPDAKAFVIVYANPKISDVVKYLIENSKRMFDEAKITPNRIVFLDGGFREDTTAEFFIVPKTAIPPSPAPTLDKSGNTLKPQK